MREIDGRAISASIAAEVTASVEQLKGTGVTPTLAVVVPTVTRVHTAPGPSVGAE